MKLQTTKTQTFTDANNPQLHNEKQSHNSPNYKVTQNSTKINTQVFLEQNTQVLDLKIHSIIIGIYISMIDFFDHFRSLEKPRNLNLIRMCQKYSR